MPNPLLKRYHLGALAATTWTDAMGGVVGANRALVAKVVVTNPSTTDAVRFSVGIAAAVGNGGKFADNVVLNPGEVYAETGLVVAAGERINAWSSTVNGIAVTVTGEEVDNL